MKIDLFYDVVITPPQKSIQQIRDRGEGIHLEGLDLDLKPQRIRFSRKVSFPALLVKGQNYYLCYDPLTEYERHVFEVELSGAYENDGGNPTPFMVIRDDHWLSFDNWYENVCGGRGRHLVELYNEWKQDVLGQKLDLIVARFVRYGWKQVRQNAPEQRLE